MVTDDTLLQVLERARTVGFLGPGPLASQVEHARSFRSALPDGPVRAVDLGAGGGLPSLPLALAVPSLSGLLVDASAKRTAFLVWAVVELGLDDRIEVRTGRAEVLAHDAGFRGQFDVAVARGFGPPSAALECGAPFVRDGGRVVISEPPERRQWSTEALASIGLDVGPPAPGLAIFHRTGDMVPTVPRSAKLMRREPVPVQQATGDN